MYHLLKINLSIAFYKNNFSNEIFEISNEYLQKLLE